MLRFGPFCLRPDRAALVRGDQPIAIQPRTVSLIRFLAERPGQVVSREALLAGVWPDVHVSDDALHQMVKRARVALGDDPAAPRYIETVHRRGWRFIAPVEVEEEARPTGDLFGREALLAQIHQELQSGPCLITLHGPGGVGKTRLARALALAWAGPVRTLDLVSLRDRASVVEAMASGLRLQLGSLPVQTISAVCGERLAGLGEVLLVLDNAEHLHPDWLGCLADWRGPGRRVLVTSRHRLGLDGERVIEVPALDPPAARQLWEAVSGGPCDDPQLDALLRRLDHLPLAIRLMAARGRLLGPTELIRQMDTDLRRLHAASGEGRHASLEAVIAGSWELLPEAARVDLARLSVAEGELDLADAEALLGPDALDRLALLEQRALVQAGRGEGGARFRLLEAVRRFGLTRGASLAGDAEQRWDEHVITGAERLFSMFRHQGNFQDLARLVARLPALRRVVERAHAAPHPVVRAAGLAARVQDWTGPASEALPWLDAAARLADQVDARTRALFLHHRSVVVVAAGDPDRGIALAERALEILPPDAPPDERATLEIWWAGQISGRGREGEAISRLEPLFHAAVSQDARFLAVQAGAQLANALYRAGRREEAVAVARRAMQLAEAEGALYLLPWIQSNLALYLTLQGAYAEAEALLVRAVLSSREAGRLERENLAQCQLAQLGLFAGWPDRARAAAEAALKGATALRASFNASIAVPALGALALLDGDLEEARRRFTAALLDHGPARGDAYRGVVLAHLALVVWLDGDAVAARAQLVEALALIPAARAPEDRLVAEVFLSLASAPKGPPLPETSSLPQVTALLEAARALQALRADGSTAPDARGTLRRLTQAPPPERPAARRWAEVAVAARLLEHALAHRDQYATV